MKKQITQLVLSIIVIAVIFLLLGRVGFYETHYTTAGRIISITKDTIYVTTGEGYVWAFTGEGFSVDDVVELTMFTNGTDLNKLDDAITAVKKIS